MREAELGPPFNAARARLGLGAVLFALECKPPKDVCLSKRRRPLGFLLGSWRSGLSGTLAMGLP